MSDIAIAALLAGAVSVEVGISVALLELLLRRHPRQRLLAMRPSGSSFIGTFAWIVLTFLAGAEVDVRQFRRRARTFALDRAGELLRPLCPCRPALLLRARLDPQAG